MKVLPLSLFVLFILLGPAQAQTTLTIEGKTIAGGLEEAGMWLFRGEEDTVIALRSSTYRQVMLQTKNQEDSIQYYRRLLAARDSLLARYATYQQRADSLVAVQNQLLTTADTLFLGYRGLYNDLKRVQTRTNFNLTGGIGLNFTGNDNYAFRPYATVGARFFRYQVNTHLQLDGQQFGFGLNYWFFKPK
jgi:hypothetical protein